MAYATQQVRWVSYAAMTLDGGFSRRTTAAQNITPMLETQGKKVYALNIDTMQFQGGGRQFASSESHFVANNSSKQQVNALAFQVATN